MYKVQAPTGPEIGIRRDKREKTAKGQVWRKVGARQVIEQSGEPRYPLGGQSLGEGR